MWSEYSHHCHNLQRLCESVNTVAMDQMSMKIPRDCDLRMLDMAFRAGLSREVPLRPSLQAFSHLAWMWRDFMLLSSNDLTGFQAESSNLWGSLIRFYSVTVKDCPLSACPPIFSVYFDCMWSCLCPPDLLMRSWLADDIVTSGWCKICTCKGSRETICMIRKGWSICLVAKQWRKLRGSTGDRSKM